MIIGIHHVAICVPEVGEPVELGGIAAIYGKDPFGNLISLAGVMFLHCTSI